MGVLAWFSDRYSKLESGEQPFPPIVVIVTAGDSNRCVSKGKENGGQNGDNFLPYLPFEALKLSGLSLKQLIS
jgi:hypothetical protein